MLPVNEIKLRPALIWAFIKVSPILILAIAFMILGWCLSPILILISLGITGAALYRVIHLCSYSYHITPELIRFKHGILNKRFDQVEMFRIKDYVITQSFLQQLFRLMDVTLKTTDPENHIIKMNGVPESDIIDTIRERVQQARKINHIYEIS